MNTHHEHLFKDIYWQKHRIDSKTLQKERDIGLKYNGRVIFIILNCFSKHLTAMD